MNSKTYNDRLNQELNKNKTEADLSQIIIEREKERYANELLNTNEGLKLKQVVYQQGCVVKMKRKDRFKEFLKKIKYILGL